MAATIDVDQRFKKSMFTKIAENPKVREIENSGMEDGRFFVHLNDGFSWEQDPQQDTQMQSFGSVREAKSALKYETRKSVKP